MKEPISSSTIQKNSSDRKKNYFVKDHSVDTNKNDIINKSFQDIIPKQEGTMQQQIIDKKKESREQLGSIISNARIKVDSTATNKTRPVIIVKKLPDPEHNSIIGKSGTFSPSENELDSPITVSSNVKTSLNYQPQGRRKMKNFSLIPTQKSDECKKSQNFEKPVLIQSTAELPIPNDLKAVSHSPTRETKTLPELSSLSSIVNAGKISAQVDSTLKSHQNYQTFIRRKKEESKTRIEDQLKLFKKKTEISWDIEKSDGWPNIGDHIKLGFKMGEGGFASVYEGWDIILQRQVAVKVVDKKSTLLKKGRPELVQNEVNIQASLEDHPNLCKFYRIIETQFKVKSLMTQIFQVMEFCGSTTIETFFSKPENQDSQKLREKFCNLVSAVESLHKQNVYHRDLTVNNVLITSTEVVKVVDFGLSINSNEPQIMPCGTAGYFTPQIIKKEKYTPSSVDIWNLGVILFLLSFKTFPFGGMIISSRP